MASPAQGDRYQAGALAADTSRAAERMQVELWRRMSPVDKARLCTELTRAVWQLSLAGVRSRHPAASDHECFLRVALLALGTELACRVYPEAVALIDT